MKNWKEYIIYIYTLEIFISRMGLNSQFYFSNFGSYYYYLYQNNVSFTLEIQNIKNLTQE